MPITVIYYKPGIDFARSVYLDTNILVYARDRRSLKYKTATSLLSELIAKKTDIFISDLVVDEFIWALLMSFYRNDTGKSLKAKIIKGNSQLLLNYKWRILYSVRKLLNLYNFNFASDNINSNKIIKTSTNLMFSQLLMPRDAFHLSFVLNLNIEGFVTSDNDFDQLNIRRNLMIYKY